MPHSLEKIYNKAVDDSLKLGADLHAAHLLGVAAMKEEAMKKLEVSGSNSTNLLSAARSLVERLDLVHEAPEYQGVWQMAQSRMGQYTGPQYKKELDTLREIVQGI